MEKCKFCDAQLEENSMVCPSCGKDNAEEKTGAEETKAETAAVEETASQAEPAPEETAPAQEASAAETAAEDAAPAAEPAEEGDFDQKGEAVKEETKVTPGKMAVMVAAIVVMIAVVVALLVSGKKPEEPAAETGTAPVETTEPAPTIPADGNPDDETCKGTYTVSDEEVKANMNTVVATIGEHELTNGQLQVFYWMQVQSFLSSEYGTSMMYTGLLDISQPLDVQTCAMTGSGTWQQFFLKEALITWQNYCVLAENAERAEMMLSEEALAYLDGMEETLESSAAYYGLESGEELLKYNVGAGAGFAEYRAFQELLMRGNLYYDAEYAKLTPTQEELEAFFAEHEKQYSDSGITREGKYVDVRHVLIAPEGGTTDETGAVTYSEEEWAACEAHAQNLLNEWTKGDCDEESFAQMAASYTQDPGSQETGGLYENVYQGQMVAEFDAWCFDEKREPGHYGLVKTTYGYHLMYFVDSTPIWQYYTEKDVMTQKSSEMMKALVAEHPMEVDYTAISLGFVDMTA